MKKIIMLLLFSITTYAYALPDCPEDTSKLWDKCFGTYYDADGDQYDGEFKDGVRHGQGTSTFVNGDQYDGEWKDNKRHGQGTYSYSSGNQYVGEYKDDLRHGRGTFTFVNGGQYVGEYKDDLRHGQGTFTFVNGEQWAGFYSNNQFIPNICEDMGLIKGSSEFGQCVIALINKL